MEKVFFDPLNEQPIEQALTIPGHHPEIHLLVEDIKGGWSFPVMIAVETIAQLQPYKKPYRIRLRTGGYWPPRGSDIDTL